MSKSIPLVPVTQEQKRACYGLLNREWYELYGRDLVEGKTYKGPETPEIIQNVQELFPGTVITNME